MQPTAKTGRLMGAFSNKRKQADKQWRLSRYLARGFVLSAGLAAMARGGDMTNIATLRQIFVDQALIEQMQGVSLRLHEPVSGGMAIRIDKPRGRTCQRAAGGIRTLSRMKPVTDSWPRPGSILAPACLKTNELRRLPASRFPASRPPTAGKSSATKSSESLPGKEALICNVM